MKKEDLISANKYKELFEVIHAIYRTANSTFTARDLLSGILRIIKSHFSASFSSIILSYVDRYPFIKVTLKKHRNFFFKKGGKNLLTKKEKEIFSSGKIYLSKNTIVVPIIFINTLGIITIRRSYSDKNKFESTDRRFLNVLAEEISLVLRNFQLYDEQRRTIVSTVKALTQFLNNYTPSSYIHSEYINKILKELAKKLRLTESQLISLEYATLLHDTGKIDIPQDILKKSSPLTNQEKEIIKKHPKKGVEILKNFQALRPVIPIILYHHEKYDGTGYPSGLKKKQIPQEARIMSIIDAFDAMVFGRPYKESLSVEEATRELERNKGTQFDADIVDVFVKILNKKEIKKYLKEKLKKV